MKNDGEMIYTLTKQLTNEKKNTTSLTTKYKTTKLG